jgi:hypothetical protein
MTPPFRRPETMGQEAGTSPEAPFLDDRDLALLRHGPNRNAAYVQLHEGCRQHVLGDAPGCTLAPGDGEAIVAQAVCDELPYILDPRLDAIAVSNRLRAALGRVRKRLLREQNDIEGTLSKLGALGGGERNLATPLQIARALDGFFGQAIDSLGAEDRNLLIEEYGLGRFGFEKRGPAASTMDLAGFAARGARKRLRRALDRLLSDAIAEHDREASLLARLRDVVGNPDFFRVLAGLNHGSR